MTLIRLILSAILLYLAYGETGAWTTLTLALILINNEAMGFIVKHQANIS